MDTKPELERVDLSAVVADELGTISQTYENAVIRRNLESNVHVRADHLVSAVIENLVTNGIVHNDRETPTVDVTLESKNGEAILTIADDGPGLPEVDEDQLIDPGEHGDQGLGLYLAETLVTEYGGALSFDDNDPRGTVVRVALPLA